MAIYEIEKKLSAFDIRPTKQRMQLASLLFGDGAHRHFTAESLFEDARRSGHQISQATIYNTLHVFCASGLIREIAVEGHRSFYDTRTDEHPHFYHEASGALEDAPKGIVSVELKGEVPENMRVTGVDVVVRIAPKEQN